MITITVGTLVRVKDILNKLANKQMPAKDSFKIMRILKAIDAEFSNAMEIQNKTLAKYADLDENGNYKTNPNGGVVLRQDSIDQCMQEMNDLYDTSITIECNKLPLSLFEDFSLSPSQLMSLEELIEYEE